MNIYYIIKTVSEIKMLEKWQRAFLRAFLAFKFAGVVFSSYLCRCNEDATAIAGCGSAKAKRACLRVHLAPQLSLSIRNTADTLKSQPDTRAGKPNKQQL